MSTNSVDLVNSWNISRISFENMHQSHLRNFSQRIISIQHKVCKVWMSVQIWVFWRILCSTFAVEWTEKGRKLYFPTHFLVNFQNFLDRKACNPVNLRNLNTNHCVENACGKNLRFLNPANDFLVEQVINDYYFHHLISLEEKSMIIFINIWVKIQSKRRMSLKRLWEEIEEWSSKNFILK